MVWWKWQHSCSDEHCDRNDTGFGVTASGTESNSITMHEWVGSDDKFSARENNSQGLFSVREAFPSVHKWFCGHRDSSMQCHCQRCKSRQWETPFQKCICSIAEIPPWENLHHFNDLKDRRVRIHWMICDLWFTFVFQRRINNKKNYEIKISLAAGQDP